MPGQPPYEYSPVVDREFDLPNGENVAVWVVPNVEHYRFDRQYPSDDTEYIPDVSQFSWREYGTRAGVWRLMRVLDDNGVRGTVALNAEVCEYEPEIVEACVERDWEIMGHGLTNSIRLWDLDPEEEREVIRATRETIEDATGEAPVGWLSPGLAETFETPRLLAEEGFEYVGDFVNDEQPYPTSIEGLVSMPYSREMGDIGMSLRYCLSGPEYARTLKDQFDVYYEEGKRPGSAKVMAISLHPYITGQPHRSKYLDEALGYITDHDDVWMTTGGEIARHYRDTYGPLWTD